jgi:hypothetical protein
MKEPPRVLNFPDQAHAWDRGARSLSDAQASGGMLVRSIVSRLNRRPRELSRLSGRSANVVVSKTQPGAYFSIEITSLDRG